MPWIDAIIARFKPYISFTDDRFVAGIVGIVGICFSALSGIVISETYAVDPFTGTFLFLALGAGGIIALILTAVSLLLGIFAIGEALIQAYANIAVWVTTLRLRWSR